MGKNENRPRNESTIVKVAGDPAHGTRDFPNNVFNLKDITDFKEDNEVSNIYFAESEKMARPFNERETPVVPKQHPSSDFGQTQVFNQPMTPANLRIHRSPDDLHMTNVDVYENDDMMDCFMDDIDEVSMCEGSRQSQ